MTELFSGAVFQSSESRRHSNPVVTAAVPLSQLLETLHLSSAFFLIPQNVFSRVSLRIAQFATIRRTRNANSSLATAPERPDNLFKNVHVQVPPGGIFDHLACPLYDCNHSPQSDQLYRHEACRGRCSSSYRHLLPPEGHHQ
jgi:hypothetical protein